APIGRPLPAPGYGPPPIHRCRKPSPRGQGRRVAAWTAEPGRPRPESGAFRPTIHRPSRCAAIGPALPEAGFVGRGRDGPIRIAARELWAAVPHSVLTPRQ